MLTAEEYANLGFSVNKNTFTTEIFNKLQFSGKRVKELMIEFAKLHSTATAEACADEAQYSDLNTGQVNKILTAYSLENII